MFSEIINFDVYYFSVNNFNIEMQEDLSAAVLDMLMNPEASDYTNTLTKAWVTNKNREAQAQALELLSIAQSPFSPDIEHFRRHVISVLETMVAPAEEVSRAIALVSAEAPSLPPMKAEKPKTEPAPHCVPIPVEYPREWAPWI